MKRLKADSIGSKANQIMKSQLEMSVLGTTSRGVFLDTSTGWIVFLSTEEFRSPLTINLGSNSSGLKRVQNGMWGISDGFLISFPQAGISIQLDSASVWTPPPPPDAKPDPASIRAAFSKFDDPFFSALLEPEKADAVSLPDIEQRALDIYEHMRLGEWGKAEEAALSLLGWGTGLTPEGDDFMIGLCLQVARSGSTGPPVDMIDSIVKQSPIRTTRMSANLIEVAAEGLADERLVSAHDALLQTSPDAQETIHNLLGWGSSSGRMALAGIMAGFLSTL